MMMRNVFTVCFILIAGILSAQPSTPNSYWIQFNDKKGTAYSVDKPEEFLSAQALQRRAKQHIAIDETDLPVSKIYLDTLKKRGLEIVHSSKWLNGATVRTSDTTLIKRIAELSFVTQVQLTKPGTITKSVSNKFSSEESTAYNPENYGNALTQLTQLNGQYFHQMGYRGKGIKIAVLDAGFYNADKIAAFDSLRNTNRILGTRDFVDPTANIYEQNYHGMSALSCMGGNMPGSLIGTAPDASYYLFRTEDASSEYLIEEDNWAVAAEYADSLGVDIINSSLGYTQFNDAKMNHTYSDLNGKTTRVTQAANMAFQKGILVFASAGNEGTNNWKRIIAPSDGDDVIAVAAVDKNGLRASFSSVGPAYGGAVKPNVAAMGSGTCLVTSAQVVGYASGSSFSSPVLAGMAACLLQANPYCSAKQIKLAIEQSASQYSSPDSLLGYGIPDFEKADKYLKVNSTTSLSTKSGWFVYPNPFSNFIVVTNKGLLVNQSTLVSMYSTNGSCLLEKSFGSGESIILNDLANLPQGILILRIRSGEKEERIKILKMAL
jgi:subtilisin family serine protease